MLNETSPSQQEWASLCAAAADFHGIACWRWMHDTNIFGVQNPEDGEIGYCCVMGNGGELFGLGVYAGSAGLLAYEMVMEGVLEPGGLDVLTHMRCVMVEFEDRRALSRSDLDVLKISGLQFRGRKSWPRFTSYLPGYLPWRLTAKEARFLTTAIGQAVEVAFRFQQDETLLNSPEPGELFFTRVPRKGETGLTWTDEWLEPAALEVEDSTLDQFEKVRLQRLKKSLSACDATWEVDVMPGPIIGDENDSDERPFIGNVFMCVEQSSGFLLNSNLSGPENPLSFVRMELIMTMEEITAIPGRVLVRKREVWDQLQPLAELLGFELGLARPLRALDQAQRALDRFLKGR